jgi:hypothetical protein
VPVLVEVLKVQFWDVGLLVGSNLGWLGRPAPLEVEVSADLCYNNWIVLIFSMYTNMV